MVKRQDLLLDIEKQKTGDEIISDIKKLSVELGNESSLSTKIREFLDEECLQCNLNDSSLIFVVFLSFVLGDIAGQMSRYIRDSNIEKIKQICLKESLNYVLVRKLTAYQSKFIDLIIETCNIQ